MRFAAKEFPEAAVAEARRLYETTQTPLAQIASGLGVAPATFRRRIALWGFVPRRGAKARPKGKRKAAAPRRAAAAVETPMRPLDIPAMAARVGATLQNELGRINAKLEAGEDVERQARTAASLVKTLADLRRLGEAGAESAGEPVRDAAALREELARRLGLPEPE